MHDIMAENKFSKMSFETLTYTGILNEIRTKLRDLAVWQVRAGCYSQAALSSNDSKTLYLFAPIERLGGFYDLLKPNREFPSDRN